MHSMWQRKNKKDTTTEKNSETTPDSFSEEHTEISHYVDELNNTEEQLPITTPKKTSDDTLPHNKTRPTLRKKPQGAPVYLQDTGNQIATVLDEIHDIKNQLHLLKIQETETKNIIQIPATHFDQQSNGLIYIPTWYTKGKQLIDNLNFYDRMNPELKLLISDENNSIQELYETFIQEDHELLHQLQKTSTTHKMLNTRLTLLKKERTNIKQHILDLVEQRLIKDIPRKQFAETIQTQRDKANLLDLQITRCTQLIQQLNHTSLGQYIQKTTAQEPEETNTQQQIQQQKYQHLQNEYQELEDKHNRLKESIEKLLNKELL